MVAVVLEVVAVDFKKLIKYLLIVIVLVVGGFVGFNIYNRIKLSELDYSKTSIKTIMKYNLEKKVYEIGKNKTLNAALASQDFDKSNFSLYTKINYHNLKNLVKNINNLNKKSYKIKDINYILNSAKDGDVEEFIKKEYDEKYINFLKYEYSKLLLLDRYLSYAEINKTSYKDTVVYVNIGLDQKFYSNVDEVKEYSELVLMNKYRKLPESFEPEALELISEGYTEHEDIYLAKVAYENFKKMADDSKGKNLSLVVNSGYRDYNSQQKTYDLYVKSYGQKYAETYAALPGYSEHQTGLAVDVGARGAKTFASTEEYKWMLDNAYKYGFVLRYPKDKVKITGYNYEPWHYRYVGEKIAKYIYENDLTFDEYYVMFLDK